MAVESMADVVAIVRDTPIGQTLHEEGREEGLYRGREAERESLLVALLRDRFGDLSEVQGIAHRLASWPDPVSAFHSITAAQAITDI